MSAFTDCLSRLQYWQDGHAGLVRKTPTVPGGHETRYLTFELDPGGLNNIRMSLEYHILVARLTGRTLVLPPADSWYLLNWGPTKRGGNQGGLTAFGDIFDLESMARWVRVLTTAEFLSETAERFPELHADLPDRFPDDADAGARRLWYERLRRFARPFHWNPMFNVLYWPSIRAVNEGRNPPSDEFVDGRTPVEADAALSSADVIHFPVELDRGDRCFGQAATLVACDNANDQARLTAMLKYAVHFHQGIFEAAARCIHHLGMFGYAALHVRRNDLQYHQSWTGAGEIVENSQSLIGSGEVVYLSTDETDESFLGELGKQLNVVRWKDVEQACLTDRIPEIWVGCVEQLICAAARVFVGTRLSTFTSYIHRLRGYLQSPDCSFHYHDTDYNSTPADSRPVPVRAMDFGREDPVMWMDPDPEEDLYTVVCTDTSPSMQWQCEFLEHTWRGVRQPGELIRLAACKPGERLPEHRYARTLRMKWTNLDADTGDVYPPYNRLYSLRDWLRQHRPEGTVLIVDPDCVFLAPVSERTHAGLVKAQRWVDFFGLTDTHWATWVSEHSAVDPAALEAATWPALIHTRDLDALLDRWIELTVALRRNSLDQISDMIAFVVALKESGLDVKLHNFTAVFDYPEAEVRGAPLIHYCQDILDHQGRLIWSKRSYQPWSQPGCDPAEARFTYNRALLSKLQEVASSKSVQLRNSEQIAELEIPSHIDVDIHIDGMEVIRLSCDPDDETIHYLFNQLADNAIGGDPLLYIQYGDEGRHCYFPRSRLKAIEIVPRA